MRTSRTTRLIREGEFIAEVEIELFYDDTGWSPYMMPEDAYRLDDIREALRKGDTTTAGQLARIYRLQPLVA
jgi:hypothetical protein